ncbi:hypothetical protein [Solimonas flava]|uniref:hypothetical protein n=1 Tax=Solimonas flava TaxID=415849 RepID=UPI0003F7D096|nr:hypothetical protein [Solimonas flava]
MTALAAERATPRREGKFRNDPAAAAKKFYQGALVCLDASGNATPGATATTLIARGVCRYTVDNSAGSAGDLRVESEAGVFLFANSASTDAITRAEIGDDCYIVDDQTVAKTDGTGTRSKAGRILDVDSDGVYVEIR